MSAVPFDTLKLADQLQAGGFSPEQARTAASAFASAVSGADLATKGDIKEAELQLESRIETVKSDILRWMFGAMVAQTGLIVALIKLIH